MRTTDWNAYALVFAVIACMLFAGALLSFFRGAYLGPMAAILWGVLFTLGAAAARHQGGVDAQGLPSEAELIDQSRVVRARASFFGRWLTLLLFCSLSFIAGWALAPDSQVVSWLTTAPAVVTGLALSSTPSGKRIVASPSMRWTLVTFSVICASIGGYHLAPFTGDVLTASLAVAALTFVYLLLAATVTSLAVHKNGIRLSAVGYIPWSDVDSMSFDTHSYSSSVRVLRLRVRDGERYRRKMSVLVRWLYGWDLLEIIERSLEFLTLPPEYLYRVAAAFRRSFLEARAHRLHEVTPTNEEKAPDSPEALVRAMRIDAERSEYAATRDALLHAADEVDAVLKASNKGGAGQEMESVDSNTFDLTVKVTDSDVAQYLKGSPNEDEWGHPSKRMLLEAILRHIPRLCIVSALINAIVIWGDPSADSLVGEFAIAVLLMVMALFAPTHMSRPTPASVLSRYGAIPGRLRFLLWRTCIEVRSDFGPMRQSYSELAEVRDAPEHLFLVVNDGSAHILPKRYFENEQHIEATYRLARERIRLAQL